MSLPHIIINKNQLSHFEEALTKEWLITNGLGGYSSSTIIGINTRKYHGLLVASLHPPSARTVCLAKLDEELHLNNDVYALGSNEFADAIFPQGHLFLKEFSVSPFPRYIYDVKNVEVRKTVFMPREKNGIAVIYSILNRNDIEVRLRIYPYLTCRFFHSVIDHKQNPINFTQQFGEKHLQVTFADPRIEVLIRTADGTFWPKANWIERLYYREEKSRGESNIDDCYQPGYFEKMIPPQTADHTVVITLAAENSQELQKDNAIFGSTVYETEILLKKALVEKANLLAKFRILQSQENDWLNWLLLTAETFSVRKTGKGRSVLAGYHWFGEWGRDTFISMPGLLFTTSRFEEAKEILSAFAQNSLNGLMPNFIDEISGKPAYNTVDASLWYVNSVLQYLKYTNDFDFVQDHLWGTLRDIVDYYEKGTEFGIHLENDGLIGHDAQLTWMDAVVDGTALTPRSGKAVEVQALWHNALRTMKLLANKFGKRSLAEKYESMASTAKETFNLRFWNEEKHCLFDSLRDSGHDATLRPNQVFAISLDFPILDFSKVDDVLKSVQNKLLTPFGLRTLSPTDPDYRGMYIGDRRSRDRSYHNGTVWPWLLGPFVTAFRKANGFSSPELESVRSRLLQPLLTQQLYEAGLGTISEIFDGDPPHLPRGCISQAWSVAEPLRAYLEECVQIKPRYENILQL